MSKDGRSVAFITAEQLVPTDQDTTDDLYVEKDGAVTLATPSGLPSALDFISADGSRVIFESWGQLDPSDTDSDRDIYEWSESGGTHVLSQAVATALVQFNGASEDGSVVVFTDRATGFDKDIYRHEGAETTLLTPGDPPSWSFPVPPNARFGAISADGQTIAYTSNRRIAAGDKDNLMDAFVWSDGAIHQISTGTNPPPGPSTPDNGSAVVISMSPSGNYVVFRSKKSLNTGDSSATDNQYIWHNGVAQRAISGLPTYPGTVGPGSPPDIRQITDDGTFLFSSSERYTADDASSYTDAFQVTGGQVSLVSQGPLPRSDTTAVYGSYLSADERRNYFTTLDPLVPEDMDASDDVYLRQGGVTTLVSGGTGGSASARTSTAFGGETPDGEHVFLQTNVGLDPSDTDGATDIYDRRDGHMSLVSVGDSGNAAVTLLGFSPDGIDAYLLTAGSLVPEDTDGGYDIYIATLRTAPVLRTAPEVTGGTSDGSTLTCRRGAWGGTLPQTTDFTWLRDGDAAAQGDSYTLQSSDVGHEISCKVSVTNSMGSTDAVSSPVLATARAPQNVQLPSLPSSASVGDQLTCGPGTWTGTAPIDFSYAWLRDGVATGGTTSTYDVADADATHQLACRVTATNAAGAVSATSPTRTVGAVPPQNSTLPAIPATAHVGDALTCTPGSWSGTAPFTYLYRWLRDGVLISGAMTSSYTVVDNDALHQVACRVTATNSGGSANATSAGTPIPAVSPANTGLPSLPTSAHPGEQISCAPGTWSGTQPLTFSFAWLRDGAVIAGSSSQVYVVAESDLEHALACRVTAGNDAGSATATSRSVTPSANAPAPNSPPATEPSPAPSVNLLPHGPVAPTSPIDAGLGPAPVTFDGVTLQVASQKGRRLASGLAITVACPVACKGSLQVRFAPATAKRISKTLRNTVLAQRSFALAQSGTLALNLRLSSTAAKTLKRLRVVTLTITAKSAAPTVTARSVGARLFGCRQPGPRICSVSSG